MTEDPLRRALNDAVPTPPSAPGRTAGALRRARLRRRRRAGATVLASAAVVAAVVVPIGLRGDAPGAGERRPPLASSTPSTTPSSAADLELACPEPLGRHDEPVAPADRSRLPEGAAVARLCPEYASFGFQAPQDALVTGLDGLVRLVNELPDDGSTACPADGGISYLVVLGYPDGSERTVRGQNFGCRTVEWAGATRVGAQDLYDAYIVALRRQRGDGEPTDVVTPTLGCPRNGYAPTSPLARVADVTAGLLCWQRTDVESEARWTSAVLDADELALVVRDITTGPRHRITEDDCRQATLQFGLVGSDRWGDRSLTRGDCGTWGGDTGTSRRLGPAAQAVVDRLVAQTPEVGPAPPSPDLRPDEVLNLYVDLVNDGDLAGARELLLDPTSLDVPTPTRLDVKAGNLTSPPPPAEYARFDQYAEQEALYRLVPVDGSFADYVDATVAMVRDDGQVWRIASISLGDVVPTGR